MFVSISGGNEFTGDRELRSIRRRDNASERTLSTLWIYSTLVSAITIFNNSTNDYRVFYQRFRRAGVLRN